jgi:hypothetical protein
LVTRAGIGTIFRSSNIARFVEGGVVKTFRCATYREGLMGQPLWLNLLHISVMPTLLGSTLLFYLANRYDWWFGYTLLLFVPFWILGFFAWNFGPRFLIETLTSDRRTNAAGPSCPKCSQPLATELAQQCLHCGADWHDPSSQ